MSGMYWIHIGNDTVFILERMMQMMFAFRDWGLKNFGFKETLLQLLPHDMIVHSETAI